MSYTRGPWTYDRMETITGPDNQVICEVFARNELTYSASNKLRQANARLIRCAPDMLEGLEEIREYLTGIQDVVDGPDGQPVGDAAMQMASLCDRLIAKAKGFQWP